MRLLGDLRGGDSKLLLRARARTRYRHYCKSKPLVLNVDVDVRECDIATAGTKHPLRDAYHEWVLTLRLSTISDPYIAMHFDAMLRIRRWVRHKSVAPVTAEWTAFTAPKPAWKVEFEHEPELLVRKNLVTFVHKWPNVCA